MEGVGLHSGEKSKLIFSPAPSGRGIQFTNKNKYTNQYLEAALKNVVDTSLAVTLGREEWKVQTVEHLLSALFMCGITDIYIDITSIEVPILDGSAKPFIDKFESIGYLEYNDNLIEPIILQNPLWVVDGDKYIIALPAKGFEISYNIHYNHPMLRSQTFFDVLSNGNFKKDIAPARTFGFLAEVEYLRSRGLAKGGSIDNAIVLDDKGYLNPSLRYENECIRHKVLDLIGDLALIGRPIQGLIVANRAGHALDIAFAKKLVQSLEEDEINQWKMEKKIRNLLSKKRIVHK